MKSRISLLALVALVVVLVGIRLHQKSMAPQWTVCYSGGTSPDSGITYKGDCQTFDHAPTEAELTRPGLSSDAVAAGAGKPSYTLQCYTPPNYIIIRTKASWLTTTCPR